MGKPTGFVEFARREPPRRPVEDRVRDFAEIDIPLTEAEVRDQAARCMDCGVPFCHGVGCPLANRVPEFNELAYRGRWKEASAVLHSTDNFPEITGRVCPAPCESACTLSINDEPVLIRHMEWQIVERAWQEGWIVPLPPRRRSGRKVAIVGSGPAGLAAAQQLARAGHEVTVFEKADRIGGLLRYGIPDFKLDKRILDRRLAQLAGEGVRFQTEAAVGEDISPRYLRRTHDAVLLALGAGRPRTLDVPGGDLPGVVMAMDYLSYQNRRVAGSTGILPVSGTGILPVPPSARDAVVAVIGGGDTGSDCVGTARRQGAREIHQLEILPESPRDANRQTPWPQYPRILRTTTSHEEGCTRHWAVSTTRLEPVEGGRRIALHAVRVEWRRGERGMEPRPVPGSEFTLIVDLVVVAMGFVHVVHEGLVSDLALKLDDRGNIALDPEGMTSAEGVLAAGDASRGASLVVHAIASGRDAAAAINRRFR